MFATDHNSSAVRDRRRGFSLIELLIVVAVILIIAAIATPNLLRAKMAANQASGLSNLRTVTSASITYWSTYGDGYPPNLATLGGLGVANCNGAMLLDETLTIPPYRKSGYELDYQAQGPPVTNVPASCGAPGFLEYLTTAVPVNQGSTGNTSYCSNEPGVIHFDASGAKPATQSACAALATLQ